MTDQEYLDKIYLALIDAYNEHDGLARQYLERVKELQESADGPRWMLEKCEESFHLHNCIASVLRDILYEGQKAPAVDDVF